MADPHASDGARSADPGEGVSRDAAAEQPGSPVNPVFTGGPAGAPPPPIPGPAETNGSPKKRESRYPPAPAQPEQAPLKVRIELRLVDGPEGKKLRVRQAAAIREALRWFAEHPNPDRSEDPPEEPR